MKLQKTFRHSLKFALFLAVLLPAGSAHADVVVIVSAKSAVTALTAEQVTKIFLGKASTFPTGGNAVAIDQMDGAPIRNEFYEKIANKSPSQISAYWTRIIFTGDGYPPSQMDSDLSVRKAVAKSPSAIGYIDKSALDSSVRVILAP